MKIYGVALLFYSSSTLTYSFEDLKTKTLTSQAIVKIFSEKDKAEKMVASLNQELDTVEKKREYVKSIIRDKREPLYGSPAMFPPLGDFYVQEIEVSD
jgi:hypothetical protein